MHARKASSRVRGWHLVTVALLAAAPASAAAGSGNYLIVTASAYAGSAPLTEFADAKAAMGFHVMTYTALPGTTREAIKAHIQGLWGTADAPNYILIVGDTDGASATANTIPHWSGGGTRQATTDLPYACMDGPDDWYPNIFIGRFSVRSVDMLQGVVDKTLCVEGGEYPDPNYVRRAAFLATDDPNAQAEQLHDWIIAEHLEPAGFECTRIYAAQGGGTQDIRDAVNNGVLFTVYFGHSGTGGWSSPNFIRDDVRGLSNAGLYGLTMGWSCNSARFSYDECFGETWLREANKGSAAYLSASAGIPSGYVEAWECSRRMERYFFQSFFEDQIWEVGPAWQEALWRMLADPDFGPDHSETRNIFEEMVLLGDPSLLLPGGSGFRLRPLPLSQGACAPPLSQVTYRIYVEQIGDFTGTITLSADGAPEDALVDFSVNSLPPPFISVLTIANLEACSPGTYNIEITGTAPSAIPSPGRSTLAELILSTSEPGPVTLTSPPDGAVDVWLFPTLTWQPATQAVDYELEIATDPDFTNVVYGATEHHTSQAVNISHTVATCLDSLTPYYWRVRTGNACGHSGFSPVFSFTTREQIPYFTEEFTGDFDLDNFTVRFIPDGSGAHYEMCGLAATELPTDPTGGTALPLSDDDYESITLSAPVSFYGISYETLYVNSNGNITFTSGDGTPHESLTVHFDRPRVSALFDDLNPATGGTVSFRDLPEDRVAVTWENVPEYGATNSNTCQIELFSNGEIHITWLGVDSSDSIVGLSQGMGLPGEFIETDISAAGPCPPGGHGDLNCDGDVNSFDIDPFVLALTNPAQYEAQYPDCDAMLADLNCDGGLDAFDIDPFVICLTTGNCACP